MPIAPHRVRMHEVRGEFVQQHLSRSFPRKRQAQEVAEGLGAIQAR